MFGTEKPHIAYNILALIKPKDYKTQQELEFRFADSYASCDNKVWEGRIIEASEVSESVEGELKLAPTFSDFSLTISNHDGALTDALLNHFWAQAEVSVYVVPKGAKALHEGLLAFKGYIARSNGVEADGDDVRINVEDILKKYDIDLPKHTAKAYMELIGKNNSYIPDGTQDEYVPLLFGNWQDEDEQYKIPVICVDTREDNDNRVTFLLCDSAPEYGTLRVNNADFGSHLEVRRIDGTKTYVPIVGTNPTQGRFWIYSYNFREGDEFFVRPKGVSSLSDLLLENPALVTSALLQAYGKVPSDFIDNTSKLIAESATKNLKVRYFLKDSKKLGDVLAELGFETGLRFRSHAGKIVFHVPDWFGMNLNWPTFGKTELLDSPKFAIDPDGLAAGKWLAKAKYNPKTDSFEIEEDVGETNRFELSEDRKLEFVWLYDRSDVLNKLLILEFLFGRFMPKVFEFTFSHRALGLKPLGGFWVDLPFVFEGPQPFLTLETQKDFVNGIIGIKALWLGYIFKIGRWTHDDHPDWANSTEQERSLWGYWTDDEGLCDPKDLSSDMSNWAQ